RAQEAEWKFDDVGSASADSLERGLESGAADVIEAGRQIMADTAAAMRSYDLSSIGIDLVSGLAQGIRNATSIATSAASSVVQRVVDQMELTGVIFSPSRVARDLVGLPLVQGIAAGIINGTPEAQIAALLATKEITEE